ncbi:hypothetical protein [uncultured Oxalicibacterium sp.]|uniref:hypothetical protein n=1 Tax=uncultured Oxalicibacterium sp. TaxID=1168540 RepID=UPI0025EAEE21|nr:hypothetical protein [uncultured Oxalicibacterium sp.]
MSYSLIPPALLAATVACAHAQPNPADPAQAGMVTTYQSAFADYLPHQDPPVPSLEKWRAANDLVGTLGGHAGHIANEAESDDAGAHHHAAPPAEKSKEQAPSSDADKSHGGHHHAH